MAEEVNIDIKIEGGDEAIKTVKDLKKQFAEAEDAVFQLAGAGKEGTAEFRKAQLEAAKLKERVDDINESLDQLKPEATFGAFSKAAAGLASGFSAATAASALFGSENEDLAKTLVKVQAAMAFAEGLKGLEGLKDGFKTLGVVIRANPLFLIVTLVTGIGAALFALKDKIEVVGKAFDFFGNIIGKVVQWFKDLSDAIGLSSFALDELTEKINKSATSRIASLERLLKVEEGAYNRRIALAKAEGKETIKLEQEKANRILQIKRQQLDAYNKAIETANEEEKQALKDSHAALVQDILNIQNEILIKNIEFMKTHFKKSGGELETLAKRTTDIVLNATDRMIEGIVEVPESMEVATESFGHLIGDMYLKWMENNKEAIMNTKDAFATLESLSKQGSASQKAFALAQVAIDTALAISALVKASQQNSLNGVTLGASGAAQFTAGLAQILSVVARVKSIISSSNPSTPSFSGGGGGTRSASPQGVNITPLRSTTSTVIDSESVENGQMVVKAIVVESDVTNKQNAVKNIEKKSKI